MPVSKVVYHNISSGAIYIATALVTALFLSSHGIPFFPIWLPLGTAAIATLAWGIAVLPSVFISSTLTYLAYFYFTQGSIPSFATLLLLPLSEIIILYLLGTYRDSKLWRADTENKSVIPCRFLAIGLSLPVIAALAQLWFLVESDMITIPLQRIATTLYLSSSIVILVATGAFINIKRKQVFLIDEKNGNPLVLAISLAIIVALTLLFGTNGINGLYTFAILVLILPIVLEFPVVTSSITLTLYILIYLGANTQLTASYLQNYQLHQQQLLFLILLSVVTVCLTNRNLIKRSKRRSTTLPLTDQETSQKLDDSEKLNQLLLEEIAKRGEIEIELENSQKLLEDAQKIAKISTWEYIDSEKSFRWITNNLGTDIPQLNQKEFKWDDILTSVHPDDVERVESFKEHVLRNPDDFEFEFRIGKPWSGFRYLLSMGKLFFSDGKLIKVVGLLLDTTEKSENLRALIETEQKYQALFDSNIDPVYVIDPHTLEITDVNPSFEKIYGYTRFEIIGKSLTQISAQPEDTKQTIANALKNGSSRVNNRLHRRKSGDTFYIEGSMVKHTVNERDLLFIISHDISRRKDDQRKLAEREHKFRAFFESNLIGMAEISKSGKWISFNNKLTSILGYSKTELFRKTLREVTYPKDYDQELPLIEQVLTGMLDGYSIEKRFLTHTNECSFCEVSVKAISNSEGELSHLIALIKDINQRKQTERDLQVSQKRLAQSQSIANLGLIRFIPGSTDLDLSEEAYRILGYLNERPEISRRDLFTRLLPSDSAQFEELICSLEAGEQIESSHQQPFITPQGELRYMMVNFGVTLNRRNEVKEVLVTLADITRVKKAEIALQEANTIKNQIFSIIGHDLVGPIGSIRDLVVLYKDRMDEFDEETSKGVLEALTRTSEETYTLLLNLIEWAKTQQHDNPDFTESNIVSIITQVLDLTSSMASKKGINLLNQLPTRAMAIIDEHMIKTVFRNLISNGIKFTPKGGTITVSLTTTGNTHQISVADTGMGIPTDVAKHLLEPEYKYSTLGTDNEKGTGLGLKLVKKFVEKNGGEIALESIVGQGTVFRLTIPALSEE